MITCHWFSRMTDRQSSPASRRGAGSLGRVERWPSVNNPVNTAQPTVVIDDQQVRVTTWTFDATGDATGPHVHEYDYIVVPVTGGTFTVVDSDGATREMTQDAGSPYRGSAGTSHNVINSTDTRAVFVEIELKL
jgi:hypothetical protein